MGLLFTHTHKRPHLISRNYAFKSPVVKIYSEIAQVGKLSSENFIGGQFSQMGNGIQPIFLLRKLATCWESSQRCLKKKKLATWIPFEVAKFSLQGEENEHCNHNKRHAHFHKKLAVGRPRQHRGQLLTSHSLPST